jgi:hypothetical protein
LENIFVQGRIGTHDTGRNRRKNGFSFVASSGGGCRGQTKRDNVRGCVFYNFLRMQPDLKFMVIEINHGHQIVENGVPDFHLLRRCRVVVNRQIIIGGAAAGVIE